MRTLSTRLPRLREGAINNVDLSLSKNTKLAERFKLQLRWELFNAFNRPQLGGPDLNPSSGSYGRITGQANAPRSMQFGVRVSF